MNVIKEITPKSYINGKHRKDRWWNEDLRQMRRNLKVARNTPAYQDLKTAYQKAIRKAKKESWNNFLNEVNSMSNASKFAHIITKPKTCTPGLTLKPDGSPTWNNLTSIQNITKTLFSASSKKPKQLPHLYLTNDLPVDTTEWINTTTINTIIANLLSSLIDYIETGFYHNQNTVAVFLDIHGAFDNIDPQRALQILENWGTPKQITNTLRSYYDKREIVTNIAPKQTLLKFYPARGTAQGNVLSPMLWNCVVNKVGEIMDNLNIGGCLFADDIVVAARGTDLGQTHAILQTAINQISNWATEEGLRFNVSKSHSMPTKP